MISRLVLFATFVALATAFEFQFKHHDNKELNDVLQQVNNQCPDITRLYELSERSVTGWPLTVIEISDHPGTHETCKCSSCCEENSPYCSFESLILIVI